MSDLMPDGDDLRKAVKHVSEKLQANPGQPLQPLVQEAIFTYNLSPKDGDFLTSFFRQSREES
jgi:hypothetical protein